MQDMHTLYMHQQHEVSPRMTITRDDESLASNGNGNSHVYSAAIDIPGRTGFVGVTEIVVVQSPLSLSLSLK
jgi:hypothetical protein